MTLYKDFNVLASFILSNYLHFTPLSSGAMGMLHILFNMVTLCQVGAVIEKTMGTIAFLGMTLFFTFFMGFMQIPIAYILHTITMNKISLFSINQCGLGFSGILFAYTVIFMKLSTGDTTIICGQKIPKFIAPFIQLIFLSLFLQASFIGHLAGIVLGFICIVFLFATFYFL